MKLLVLMKVKDLKDLYVVIAVSFCHAKELSSRNSISSCHGSAAHRFWEKLIIPRHFQSKVRIQTPPKTMKKFQFFSSNFFRFQFLIFSILVITYEVYVQTGDRLGAGSKVNVKITIFGEYGNSGERQLLRSKTHRNKFQRGQVRNLSPPSLPRGCLSPLPISNGMSLL